MKTYIILIGLLLTAKLTHAQDIIYDFTAQPVFVNNYDEYKGTPFWYEEWKNGTVKLKNGRSFKDLSLKYDIVGNQVVFIRVGTLLKFDEPVAEFMLGDEQFRSGYNPIDGKTERSFYQVLSKGKIELLKRINKTVTESRAYGVATLKKEFTSTTGYYIARGSQLSRIKKEKRSILEAIGDKSTELEAYISANKLDLKTDSDIVSLVTYYNTL